MSLNDVAAEHRKEKQKQEALNACATVFWTIIIGTLFLLVGWNYGVTEMVEALGGPDGNINVLHALATFAFLGVLKHRGAPTK